MTHVTEKLHNLAKLIELEQKQRLFGQDLAGTSNLLNVKTTVKMGRKYAKIDLASSGKYMVEIETEIIYGIKAYGVVHKGHYYGTLDTINDYFWGDYQAYRKPS